MWFRLYTDTRDDPKVQRLPGETFKHWINLLCLAKEGDGLLPSLEDIAYKLKISDAEAQRLTEELVKRKLLDSDGTNLSPHNWHQRQFESDSSTERVKRHRNVSRNVTETTPEQIQSRAEPDTEPEQSRGGSGETPSPASRAKPRSVRAPVLPDDEFLDGLQKNPAYSMLDVRHCYQRMLTWCQVNSKQPSRRRFINWLNREDKPMTAKPSPPKGNAHVGKHKPTAEDKTMDVQNPAYMDEFVDTAIRANDLVWLAKERDAILKRGGAAQQWESRVLDYFTRSIPDDVMATPEEVATLKRQISELANRS